MSTYPKKRRSDIYKTEEAVTPDTIELENNQFVTVDEGLTPDADGTDNAAARFLPTVQGAPPPSAEKEKRWPKLLPCIITAVLILTGISFAVISGQDTNASNNISFSSVSTKSTSKSTSSSSKASSSSSQNSYSYSSVPRTGTAGALAKATSYLNSSAFSYTGLISQLEYSGFSKYEATYAANNCGANWNTQALRKAKSYLSSSAFSYKGLIEQLEYVGFTESQAKYAADRCGANWNEQAVKKAKSYLNSSSNWTKSKLKKQLEYSGFTSSQADYGVKHCGKRW